MNALRRHLAAIERGEITKTNVIGMKKAINAAERIREGCSVSATAPRVTVSDTMALRRRLSERRPIVRGELHDSGLKVLRNPRYAKRLASYADSIAAADHFRLVGFDMIGRRGSHAVPVYAVWSKIPLKGGVLDGGTYEAFRFRNIPWQTAYYEGEESGPVIVGEY